MIIPNLVYEQATVAIEWLTRVFGFEVKMQVPGAQEGSIAHAQLTYGQKGMIMISSVNKAKNALNLQSPITQNGLNTQGLYIITTDIEQHYNRALSEGAKIAKELTTQPYGGQDYSCYDCEGHLWSFGTYDPWA